MSAHTIVSRDQWLESRRDLLTKEKAVRLELDELAKQRRELPWVKIEKDYQFETVNGQLSLADLFGNKSQLMIYHFMFGPGWKQGCVSCSFLSDHFDSVNLHLAHHNVSLVAVARAPLADFSEFKQRMGWSFPWVSSSNNDFNFDFGVSFTKEQIAEESAIYNYQQTNKIAEEMPGMSVFVKDEEGRMFHTYSTYTRGLDILLGTHNFLDMTPNGRNEKSTMDWVRHHDKYKTNNATILRDSAIQEDKCCSSKENP
ncbi:MAG: thioredoxin family protein [Gimesia sp.]